MKLKNNDDGDLNCSGLALLFDPCGRPRILLSGIALACELEPIWPPLLRGRFLLLTESCLLTLGGTAKCVIGGAFFSSRLCREDIWFWEASSAANFAAATLA